MEHKKHFISDFNLSKKKRWLFMIDATLISFFGACALVIIDDMKK